MSTELDTAADEALARWRSVHISYFPVYPGGQKQFNADCQTLAQAHVSRLNVEAAIKAELVKPVNEEWLRWIGFDGPNDAECLYIRLRWSLTLSYDRKSGNWRLGPIRFGQFTRKQVKNLVEALGGLTL